MKHVRLGFGIVVVLIATLVLWWSYSKSNEFVEAMSFSEPQPSIDLAPDSQPGWNFSSPEDGQWKFSDGQ